MPYIIETFDKPGHRRAPAAARRAPGIPDANKGLLPAAPSCRTTAPMPAAACTVDDTREAAQQFIDADPFAQAGLFERVAITRWRKAYVDGVCHL